MVDVPASIFGDGEFAFDCLLCCGWLVVSATTRLLGKIEVSLLYSLRLAGRNTPKAALSDRRLPAIRPSPGRSAKAEGDASSEGRVQTPPS